MIGLIPDAFELLLLRFNSLVAGTPSIDKVRKELQVIKDDAHDNQLTDHQKDAIICRVANYMRGEYGEQNKATNGQLAQLKKTRSEK